VQGLTEFIPVSSSGHLILAHRWLGVEASGLSFDVALHIGTLAALVLYFHKDIWQLVQAVVHRQKEARLAWLLALATIPAVIAGLLLQSRAESVFRSPLLVAVNLAVVALIMLGAEYYYRHKVKKPQAIGATSLSQALIMGTAQAAAIVPGMSRSGSTIVAGLFVGMERVAATRFSFLLGIPITFGAIIKVLSEPQAVANIKADQTIFIIGILTAFLSGLFAIRFLLNFLSKHSLAAFAYYRLALAAVVLTILALQ
jgi:undecaprenyl-diphosphatase